jgi:threonine dehydrogenase-like Zn-dependent dehydrogenase
MKAVCWYGTEDVRVENVPEPKVLAHRDAVIRISLTAICGSDLHLYNGYVPMMRKGDILGHEFMGEVVEVGRDVHNLKKGDRVVVPFTISCGACFYCRNQLWALCSNTNPDSETIDTMYGFGGAGLFGYSHLYGGFAGGQAQYARVPFADVGPYKVPEEVSDEQALFLSDIFATGYQAAENCNIHPGDVVAVWGCGPMGQFAIRSAYLLGAERVIALDRIPARLEMARQGGADAVDVSRIDVVETLKQMTGGRGPDSCIDAVGMEAHGLSSIDALYDRAKQAVRLETDRPHVLRQVIQACRPGGTVSVAGAYGGFIDKFPMGAAFAKGLTFKTGQTHVPRYFDRLMKHIRNGDIDPSFVITHRLRLDDAPAAYKTFRDKTEDCIKVVLNPN